MAIGQAGRFHQGDSIDYTVVDLATVEDVMSTWGGPPRSFSEPILLYRGDVVIAGPLEATMVVVDGNATVQGRVSVDDPCGLFVRGALKCDAFWARDAETRIGSIEVAKAAFIALSGGGEHDLGPIYAPVLFTDTLDFPMDRHSKVDQFVCLDEDRALLCEEYAEASLDEVFEAYLAGRAPFHALPNRSFVPRKPSEVPFLRWVLEFQGEDASLLRLSRALAATQRRRDDFPDGDCSPDELINYLVGLHVPDAQPMVRLAHAAWQRADEA